MKPMVAARRAPPDANPAYRAGCGPNAPMTLIMVRAQDHLMNSLLAREFSEELIHFIPALIYINI